MPSFDIFGALYVVPLNVWQLGLPTHNYDVILSDRRKEAQGFAENIP